MQLSMRFIVALFAAFLTGVCARSDVTPVQKVIQMLMGMLEKGKKEKHEEQVQFATYRQFCSDTEKTTTRSIKEDEEKITMLKADIQKYQSDAEDLSTEIQELEGNVATFTGDQKAATKVRELERSEYEAAHKDYTESVDAITKAVAVLKKQAYDRKQAGAKKAMLQVVSLKKVPEDSKRVIEAFLSKEYQPEEEADGYEFQSHGVIDMLEKLKDKFIDERTDLEKKEMEQRHAHKMLSQDLTASISNAEAAITTKSQSRSQAKQLVATRQGDLQDTVSTKADDTKYLEGMTSSCSQKSKDFEARQKLRTEEVAAIEKAVEILSSDDVKGASEKHLPSMLQKKTALAQLRASNTNPSNQIRMAAYLNDQATHIGSRMLAMLAVRAAEDPFGKVKKMLRDLITRLEEQAGEEAQHKTWCDAELGENEKVRTTRTSAVDSLRSQIDELSASINKIAAEVTELTLSVSELEKNSAKETEMRAKEKAENQVTIQDSKDAQAAVARALVVLKEFYEGAADAQALLQTKQNPEAPEVFSDQPYKGMGAESGGVIGMLEVIQSDFARLQSDTEAAEVSQAAAHDKFMTETAVTKTQKTSDITHKGTLKQNQEQQLSDKTNDLAAEEKELDAANKYFEKLKPSCLDAGMSFQEREARRKEEIESLQEALRILNGEDIAFLQQQDSA